MRQKRFRLLRQLLVYLLVLGMIFSFPVTRVMAASEDDEPAAVAMELAWPEGMNGEVVENVSNYYYYGDVLDGSTLTITYADETTAVLKFYDDNFRDSEGYSYDIYPYLNNYDDGCEWTVGTDKAKVIISYYYASSVDPLTLEVPITIVEDTEIISWEEAKSQAIPLTDGMNLSFDNKVSFIYENWGSYKEKGTLCYIDVPYKKVIKISSSRYVYYGLFKDSDGNPAPLTTGSTAYDISLKNGVSDSIRYYLSYNPYYDGDTATTISIESSDLPVFDDVKASARSLVEGSNTKLDESDSVAWYTVSGDSYDYNEMRLVKLTIPAGKAVSVDSATVEGWGIYAEVFGENGDINNALHSFYLNNDRVMVDSLEGGRIVNDSNAPVNYYFGAEEGLKDLTITYHNFVGGVTVTVYPNYPEELEKEKYDYEKQPRENEIDADNPSVDLYNGYFSGDGMFKIIGWEDMDSSEQYPADYTFYPAENRNYNLEAVWEENPYCTVTLDPNYPTEWGMQPVKITKKVYESQSINPSSYDNKIERKEGYKIVDWYYLENDEKQYVGNSYYTPEEDITLYGEWDETDEVKVTVHSNYPRELGLDEVECVGYTSPGEYYWPSYNFETPDGYSLTGWKNEKGENVDMSYGMIINQKTDIYAQWRKIYTATLHSNYPAALGKTDETLVKYDSGEGVYLGRNEFNSGKSQVKIVGWSKTKNGTAIGVLDDDYFLEADTHLYAIWEVPATTTYTFHSNYPAAWNMQDKTVQVSTDLDGKYDVSGLDSAIPGKNGATIVAWEDDDGFLFLKHPDAFEGSPWYYTQDFFAIWSTRPTVTINTNFPEGYSWVGPEEITLYANRINEFSLYKFNEAGSVHGYNCKLTDKTSGKSYVYGEDTAPIKLTKSIVMDAEWKLATTVTIHAKYSDGEDFEDTLNCLWDGGYNLPKYSYVDSATGTQYVVAYYKDSKGKKYETNVVLDIPDNTELFAQWEKENPLKILENPVDKKSIYGSLASFSVTAISGSDDSGLTYCWQCSTNGTGWSDVNSTGCKTSLLKVTVSSKNNKMKYRCKVSDGTNTAYSDAAELTCYPVISVQPKNYTGEYGKTATFTVTSRSKNATFKWQTSKDGKTWEDLTVASASTNTLKVVTKENAYYRCRVTVLKYTEPTSIVKLIVKPSISVSPVSQSSFYGDIVKFSVKAAGPDLSYTWQYSRDGKVWAPCSALTGYTTPNMYVRGNTTFNNVKFRCQVKSGTQIVYSDTADFVSTPNITKQPVNQSAKVGGTASFSVTAEGGSVKCQWQYSADDGKTWKTCTYTGNKTNKLTVKVTAANKNYSYRCYVTNATAKEYSNAVKVVVK